MPTNFSEEQIFYSSLSIGFTVSKTTLNGKTEPKEPVKLETEIGGKIDF